MIHYADSSFLVSCYVLDAHTAKARGWLSQMGVPLVFTVLHSLEVRNAFRLGVFRNLFSAAEAAAARSNLERDLRSGRLTETVVRWPAIFRNAARLSESHSAITGTRSLDLLHVAVAKAVRAVEFVSFDARQRALATAAGLSVGP